VSIQGDSSYRVRTFMAATVAIAAVTGTALFTAEGPRRPASESPSPSTVTSESTVPPAPVPSGPTLSSIDYVSSEGSGRLTITGHGRSDGLTLVEVALSAATGYQSFTLMAYDDRGAQYDAVSDRTPSPQVISGTIAAGETLQGNVAFDAPPGPLVLVLVNDRYEAVAALRVS